jgi:hypothetical protein
MSAFGGKADIGTIVRYSEFSLGRGAVPKKEGAKSPTAEASRFYYLSKGTCGQPLAEIIAKRQRAVADNLPKSGNKNATV